MAQQKYLINDVEIWQPDEDLAWDYETTYTADSGRVQSGIAHFTEMFTVELFQYQATDVPASEWAKISQMIIGKTFNLYAWNPHFGKWRVHRCKVAKGSLVIGTLEEGYEKYSSISFNIMDTVPLERQT